MRDRWNVTQKLTLDLGLRYEVYPVLRRANRGMEMLDLDTLEIVIGGRGPDNPATVMDESSESLGVKAEKDLVAPRFGVIYRLNDKTVARAGYGLAFSGEDFTRPFRGDASYPGALNHAVPRPTDGNQNWGWRATLGRRHSVHRAAVERPGSAAAAADSANTRTMVPETVVRPRIHSWNFAFERQLPVLDVGRRRLRREPQRRAVGRLQREREHGDGAGMRGQPGRSVGHHVPDASRTTACAG